MEYECIVCSDEVQETHWKKGYRACWCCREKQAQKLKKAKSKQVAPAFNKGSYQMITSRQMIKDLGR
jgi:DNA-directed RNA polymerase subunit RPC12/RpoP